MVLEAARRLKAGGTVAIATETVYGLFCDSTNEAALSAVYAMKGRPASNPLIAHVLDAAMAKRTTFGFDARAEKLAAKFWPGPLAIVLPRRPEIAAIGVGGRGTVAVRAQLDATAESAASVSNPQCSTSVAPDQSCSDLA